MDSVLAKAGSYLFTKRANKELESFGDDVNDLDLRFTPFDNSYPFLQHAGNHGQHMALSLFIESLCRTSQLLDLCVISVVILICRCSCNETLTLDSPIQEMCMRLGGWIEQAMSSSVEEGAKRLYNRLLGKTQTPLPDLLQRFELPKGIFPKNALNYEFNEANGKLVVLLPFICEVGYRDSSIVRFAQRVTAVLEKGKLTNIEGIKTKAYMMWMKVTSVVMDTPGGKKVTYITGSVNNKRPIEAYVVMRDGIEADVF